MDISPRDKQVGTRVTMPCVLYVDIHGGANNLFIFAELDMLISGYERLHIQIKYTSVKI